MNNLDFENLTYDKWLSNLLGYNAYHLSEDFSELNLSKITEKRFFIDAKVKTDSLNQISFLTKIGFNLVDTNINLIKKSFDLNFPTDCCRFALDNDLEAVSRIAHNCFTKSRFHLDPLINNNTANKIKSEWAKNFFFGKRGKWMVVALDNNKVCGFLLMLQNDTGLTIDLIGVELSSQSKGFGKKMISYALKNCTSSKEIINVGTQLCNFESLTFYQKLGFNINNAKYIFHLHKF